MRLSHRTFRTLGATSMKVLLASLSIEPDSRFPKDPNAPYPLGLAYLYSITEQEGHSPRLLFLNSFDQEHSEREFFRTVEQWNPDLVGLQIFSMNRVSTFRAIERLSEHHPSIRVVIGGIHTSVMYDQIIRRFPAAVAVLGEGEETFREILRATLDGTPLDAIRGVAFSRDGDVVKTPPRPLVGDMDSLPVPRHELFFDQEPGRTVAHMITSRGCPYDCSFCCLKTITLRRYRKRSVESVFEEIRNLKRKYPRLRQIQIHDDTFLLDNRRVIDLCKQLVDANFGVTFICSARVKPVSRELFEWMKKAGFEKIMFGLETGSGKLLHSIHKNIKPDDVLQLFHMIRPFDFLVTTFLMCGFPGESDDTVRETIALVRKTQRIHYNWNAGIGKLWVYPGTEVHQIMKEKGHITDDFWMAEEPVPFFTVEHDLDGLIRFEETMMNHLSVSRALTVKGFFLHSLRFPFKITRFLYRTRSTGLWQGVLLEPVRLYFPKLHTRIMDYHARRKQKLPPRAEGQAA